MARTGRFGRLPSAAPDLTSQIVSLMEQWQNARDSEIMDAWTNGGTFNGKKVTDKDMLKYYRKRRDSYDKDEPEYNRWDNDMWQLRFRMSNENVMMNYRMGRIGPRAVAAHYRAWARRMPANSSFHRNLMQSYGDFMKAAKAGRQHAKKAFDYNAMLKRIDNNNKGTEDYDMLTDAVSVYARAHGYIENHESITDPNVLNRFEAGDLSNLMLNVQHDENWPEISARIKDKHPDWDGVLTWPVYERAMNESIRAHRANIREYKKAPFDTRGLQAQERNSIAALQSAKDLPKVLSAWELYNRATSQWQQWGAESVDGKDHIAQDGTYIESLKQVRKQLLMAGDEAGAGAVNLWIEAVSGNVSSVQGAGAQTALGLMGLTPGDIEETARAKKEILDAIVLVDEGRAAWTSIPPTVDTEAAQRIYGTPNPKSWGYEPLTVNTVNGRQQLPDDSRVIIPTEDSSGKLVPRIYEGQAIVDPTGKIIGHRYSIDGENLDGFYYNDGSGRMAWTMTDQFDGEEGIQLVNDGKQWIVQPAGADTATVGTWMSQLQTRLGTSEGDRLDEWLGDSTDDGTAITGPTTGTGAAPGPVAGDPGVDQATGPAVRGSAAYQQLQRILGPEMADLEYGALGALDNNLVGDVTNRDQLAEARLVALRELVPPIWAPEGDGGPDPNVDSVEAQTAWMRDYLRRSAGLSDLPYTDEDAKYYGKDGTPVARVTAEDRWNVDQGIDPDAVKRKEDAIRAAGGAVAQPGATTAPGASPAPTTAPSPDATPPPVGTAPPETPAERLGPPRPDQTPPPDPFRAFWMQGGGKTSSPGPSQADLDQGYSIQHHLSQITDPANNPEFADSPSIAWMNGSQQNAAKATGWRLQDVFRFDVMNYSQTDAVVSDATLKAYADFVAYGDFKASIRGLLAAGANPNALQIAEIMGQQYSREERFNQIGDLAEAEGLEFNDREGTPTPRWDVSQGGYARPEPGGRVTPVEQMRPSMPTDLVDPARPQPNVKLPGNVSTILGMPQQQKVDIKTPYIEQIGQQTFESQRLIPQRVPSDIGVAANLTSAPAAAPTTKPASPYTPSSGPRRV